MVGENGAGKSTVLKVAAAAYDKDKGNDVGYYPSDFFLEPTGTRLRVSNLVIKSSSEIKRKVSESENPQNVGVSPRKGISGAYIGLTLLERFLWTQLLAMPVSLGLPQERFLRKLCRKSFAAISRTSSDGNT